MVALKGHRLCDAGSNTRAVPSSRQLGRIAPQMLLLCPLPKLGSDAAPNASSHPSPLGTGIPLILHTPRGSKEQFRCVFFFPSRSLSTHVSNSHVKKALRLPRRQHAPSQGLETSAACVFQTHESARFFVVFFFGGWVGEGTRTLSETECCQSPFSTLLGTGPTQLPKAGPGGAQPITSPLFFTQVRGDSGVL